MTKTVKRKQKTNGTGESVQSDEEESSDAGSTNEEQQQTSQKQTDTKPVGVDIGTENLIVSKHDSSDSTQISRQRNAFIEVDNDEFTRKMMQQQQVSYVESNGKLYILGDSAFDLSRIFSKNPRRPIDRGVLAPEESDAIPVIKMMLKRLAGESQDQEGKAVYSVPADPIDADFDVQFHRAIFQEMLSKLGYESDHINEGHAVALSELEDEDFTGIAVSFGAGMTNCCIAYESIPALTFSTSRGGRWIDERASKVSGEVQSRVTAMKENGVDVMNPDGRVEKAISIYYRELLNWTLQHMAKELEEQSGFPEFSHPVTLVAAGGTAAADGFADLFQEVYEDVGFPIDIANFRVADKPLNSVSKGCLVSAQL